MKKYWKSLKEERNILHTRKIMLAKDTGHIWCRNCLKIPTEGTIERRLEVTVRRGRRCKRIQNYLKITRLSWKLKDVNTKL